MSIEKSPPVDLPEGWKVAILFGPSSGTVKNINELISLPGRIEKIRKNLEIDGSLALGSVSIGSIYHRPDGVVLSLVHTSPNHQVAFTEVAKTAIYLAETCEDATVVKSIHMGNNRIFDNLPADAALDTMPSYDQQYSELQANQAKEQDRFWNDTVWHEVLSVS